jgi:hypothetical protein
VTQAIRGPWDVVARLGNQRLAYRRSTEDVTGVAAEAETGRTDTVRFFGGGIGYKVGPDTRLGFNVDYYRRTSDRHAREYKGFRAGTSLTYGF